MATSYCEGMRLRQAALTAGIGKLVMPVTYAEFFLYPQLVIPGNIEQTVRNISGHGGLFVAAMLCYLMTAICDLAIAWALYVLLAPVNRSLSLLIAWLRLLYTAMFLFATLNLVTVYRLPHTPDYQKFFGAGPLYAQVQLLLNSFRYQWSFSLLVFAFHLVLLGCLIYRAGYIPGIIGILLVINGLGWVVDSLRPFLYPNAKIGFVSVTFLGELVFMLWLLIRGWKIAEPAASAM
jgi:hypothetical protein